MGEKRTDTSEQPTSSVHGFFRLTENATTVRTEGVAGLTTFLAMAYSIFVNPGILSAAGMDPDAMFTRSCTGCSSSSPCTSSGWWSDR